MRQQKRERVGASRRSLKRRSERRARTARRSQVVAEEIESRFFGPWPFTGRESARAMPVASVASAASAREEEAPPVFPLVTRSFVQMDKVASRDADDEDTLVDFDTQDAFAFGVPRPVPFLRLVLLVLTASAAICVAALTSG